MTITPAIMCGGSGTRLWPLSRTSAPKQYHALVGEESMLEQTLSRVAGGERFADPLIIAASADAERVRAQARGTAGGVTVIGEPVGRNTAPVAIVASLHVAKRDPEGLVLLLPADHHVADPEGFRRAVAQGEPLARQGHLVTLGIDPVSPETGYGYIKRGTRLGDGVFAVERFVEKPDRATAERYLAEGGYSWNAGIFLFRARDFLEEAQRFVPVIVEETRKAYDRAAGKEGILHLDEASFAQVPADSIDYAVMEKTNRAAVVAPVSVGWNDIGSWAAVSALDDGAGSEKVVSIDCEGTFVRSTGPLVATLGLKDVVVIATDDAVLVVDASRTQEVKTIVEQLKTKGRQDLL